MPELSKVDAKIAVGKTVKALVNELNNMIDAANILNISVTIIQNERRSNKSSHVTATVYELISY